MGPPAWTFNDRTVDATAYHKIESVPSKAEKQNPGSSRRGSKSTEGGGGVQKQTGGRPGERAANFRVVKCH